MEVNRTFYAFLFCIVLASAIGYYLVAFAPNCHRIDANTQSSRCSVATEKFAGVHLNQLLRLGRHISSAHRHARSGKAILELNQAYNILRELLGSTYKELLNETLPLVPAGPETRNPTPGELPDVCDEYFGGTNIGYPWFVKGWLIRNCTAKPIKQVVSVLVNARNMASDKLENILKGLNATYPTVTAIVAAANETAVSLASQFGAKVLKISGQDKDGGIWKKLAKSADTKYVLLAKDLYRFDNQSQLERLIRLASYVDIDIVGGSIRFYDGRWFRGCHQMALRNYTLKLVEGYDFAYKSCVYCNYMPGPFLIRPETFSAAVDESLEGEFVFLDFFMKRFRDEAYKQLVCPEVMFNVEPNELHLAAKTDWLPLAKAWTLNRVVFPNSQSLSFSCEESNSGCSKSGGIVLPICCLQELADATKYAAMVSDETNGTLELDSGSVIGAVKMYGVLPWERDQDFNWLADDNEQFKLMSRQEEFKKHGYGLSPERADYAKCYRERKTVNCGYIALRTKNWRLELWGVIESSPKQMVIDLGLGNVTRVLCDGMWVKTYHNPAMFARNRYEDDIFEHVEHWGTLSKGNSWVKYETGKFLGCPRPGFHGCLNLFLPVGNIQFQDIYV